MTRLICNQLTPLYENLVKLRNNKLNFFLKQNIAAVENNQNNYKIQMFLPLKIDLNYDKAITAKFSFKIATALIHLDRISSLVSNITQNFGLLSMIAISDLLLMCFLSIQVRRGCS